MSGAGDAAGAPREARIGIINVSDRAAAGVYEDLPGKAIVAALGEYLVSLRGPGSTASFPTSATRSPPP